MAKQKLSELEVTKTIGQDDLLYVVQSNTSKAVNVKVIASSLVTANIREHSSNLYFTNTRARSAITVTGSATYDTANGIIFVTGVAQTYVANVNGQNGEVTLTTANVNESDNLYYTNARVFANVSSLLNLKANVSDLTTANVIENNNLYFNNARSILANIPATNQIVVSTPVFNYNFDQYSGDNPTIYVSAGETISFELTQSSAHPFAIRESNGGPNYNTGLTHIALNGTLSTGSSAQGKTSGKLFWKIPFNLAGNTYVYQCTVHSSMVGSIVIQKPLATLTTTDISEGNNFYFSNNRVTQYFTNTAPVSSSSSGTTGEIRFDSDYIYVCVASGSWKRANLTIW